MCVWWGWGGVGAAVAGRREGGRAIDRECMQLGRACAWGGSEQLSSTVLHCYRTQPAVQGVHMEVWLWEGCFRAHAWHGWASSRTSWASLRFSSVRAAISSARSWVRCIVSSVCSRDKHAGHASAVQSCNGSSPLTAIHARPNCPAVGAPCGDSGAGVLHCRTLCSTCSVPPRIMSPSSCTSSAIA